MMATPPKTQNRVYTVNLMRDLNVAVLADCLKGHLDPNLFPACTLRNRKPWASLSIQRNGKIVIAGAKTLAIAIEALYKVLRKIYNKLGEDYFAEAHNLKLQNLVSNFDVGYHLDQDLFYDDHRAKSTFNAVDIRALHYYPNGHQTKPVLIMWRTGKCHIAGAMSHKEIMQIYETTPFIKYKADAPYRKLGAPRPPIHLDTSGLPVQGPRRIKYWGDTLPPTPVYEQIVALASEQQLRAAFAAAVVGPRMPFATIEEMNAALDYEAPEEEKEYRDALMPDSAPDPYSLAMPVDDPEPEPVPAPAPAPDVRHLASKRSVDEQNSEQGPPKKKQKRVTFAV